jgi:hypothetical protein
VAGNFGQFAPLKEFRGKLGKLSREDFIKEHPHPVLLLEKKEGDFVDPGFQTVTAKPERASDTDPELQIVTPVPAGPGSSAQKTIPAKGFVVEGKPQDQGELKKALTESEGNLFICTLVKRDPNKFASMITVGRAANNDVRVNLPTLSKFHAYFTHIPRDGLWFITDANSSNGTWVDGERLRADRGRAKLANGSAIRFGPDVLVRFFESANLFDFLKGTQV